METVVRGLHDEVGATPVPYWWQCVVIHTVSGVDDMPRLTDCQFS